MAVSLSNKLRLHPLKGKHLPEEWRKHLSEHHWSKKEGFIPPMKGKHQTEKAIQKKLALLSRTPKGIRGLSFQNKLKQGNLKKYR